jgi:putative acetyltransferase
MAVTISVESPLQDELREVIAALNAHLLTLSPAEFCYHMSVEEMAEPETTVFVARDEAGRVVGTGSLRREGDGVGEVKRMYTLPEVRGQRVGSLLLDEITALAVSVGVKRLVLETGSPEGFAPAWRLYEKAGFSRCGAVLDYADSEWSVFYEKYFTPELA